MNNVFRLLLIYMSLLVLTAGCKNHSAGEKGVTSEPEERIPSVCIWDGIYLREEPHQKGKYITTLSLGETVMYLGESITDSISGTIEYLKLELSDGTKGYASSGGLVLNADAAVIVDEIPMYVRPDLMTITDNKFLTMDIIAIQEQKDQWLNVTGERKKLSGWIREASISKNKEDIALAVLASRQLRSEDDIPLYKKIEDILNTNPYPNSVFVNVLKQMAQEEKEKYDLDNLIQELM